MTISYKAGAVIPTRNESKCIGPLVKNSLNYVNKVIVVDNSSDNTAEIAESVGAEVIIGGNGKTDAIRIAQNHVRMNPKKFRDYRTFIISDGDDTSDQRHFKKIREIIERGEVDCVLTTRWGPIEPEPKSFRRLNRVANKGLAYVVAFAYQRPDMTDACPTLYGLTKKTFLEIPFISKGFATECEVINYTLRNCNVEIFPIKLEKRDEETRTKLGYSNFIKIPANYLRFFGSNLLRGSHD